MIDMKIGVKRWLLPDGTTTMASNPGTEGSMGVPPAEREWMPHLGARLAHFCADFILCTRHTSPALVGRMLDSMKAQGVPVELLEIRTGYDGSGHIAACGYTVDAELWEREPRNQINRVMTVRAA